GRAGETGGGRPPRTATWGARPTRRPPAGRCTAPPPRERGRGGPACSAARRRSDFARAGQVHEGAAELELARQPAAALECQVELGEPDDRVPELVGREVRCLLKQLLDVEAVLLQPLRGLAWR